MVGGAVQGVGFRPFVYNLAARCRLAGFVANTANGVAIEAQGAASSIDCFLGAIRSNHPPLASPTISSIETVPVDEDDQSFVISPSQGPERRRVAITPDAATCRECLAELADSANRRYRYAFINCTNCGPRYTIVRDLPYDRPNTTMSSFQMCPECLREYTDPASRRFHAQPNACALCGPKVWLTNAEGRQLESGDAIGQTVSLLEAGRIVALKGIGGFHLAARADSDAAVEQLRQRKYRKAKAFAIMVRDIEAAGRLAIVGPAAVELLSGVERPIVLCPKRQNAAISELVAPNSRYWGIMLPYSPIHESLLKGDSCGLVMTSGNNSDEPIENDNDSAVKQLGGIADYFLMHNRDIHTRCDDSVVKVSNDKPMMIRRARGYVPRPISVERRSDADILAVGAHLKSTVTYLKGPDAFVSQHIGDLADKRTYESFLQTVKKLGDLVGAAPAAVACDLHPSLLSSRFAERHECGRVIRVQHHHAHIAGVMAEHRLDGPVVGLAADGVGYGADGTVWGCELLSVWPNRYEHRGRLEQVHMPGGDAASRQGWRMAVSHLVNAYGPQAGMEVADQMLPGIGEEKINVIGEMIAGGVNSPMTSSLGRLFDAVSAMLGVCTENSYEAQAAIELEYAARQGVTDCYPVVIEPAQAGWVLKMGLLVRDIVDDLAGRVEVGVIAARFCNWVAAGLAALAGKLACELGTAVIAVSGGVFQNDVVLDGLICRLREEGLQVYFNEQLPVNDGAISFGQAVVADAVLAEGAN